MSWLRRRGSKTSEDQFADEVTELVKRLHGMEATRVEGFALRLENPGGSPITMNLANVYLEAQRLTGPDREARLRTAVLAMAPQPRPATWAEAEPRLMPAVRTVSWLAAAGLVGVVNKALAPFIAVLCAIDYEHGMTFVTDEDLAKWGVSAEEAFDTASANLVKRPVQVGRAGPIAIVLEPDGYISSWLAAPMTLWRIAKDLGTDVLAIAPSRDQLALVDASDMRGTTVLLEDSLKDYQEAPRQLSPVPYRIAESGVEVWVPPQTHPARTLVHKAQGILANVEYGLQQSALQERLTKAGEDVFVAGYALVQRPDGSVWSWAAWAKQVTNGLVPQVDLLLMGDNENKEDRFAVRWHDAIKIGGATLRREPAFDPPRWRYRGWPDAATIAVLRKLAVPFPPPRDL
jgi:hypothetical protein